MTHAVLTRLISRTSCRYINLRIAQFSIHQPAASMKAFFFLVASCFLCTGLATSNLARPIRRTQKHHKAVHEFAKYPAAAYGVPELDEIFNQALPTGLRKVYSLDMTDPTQQCPAPWSAIQGQYCGKSSPGGACDSLTISTPSGASYQTVCGRFRGYQIGTPDAFNTVYGLKTDRTIEGYYVDGISITYGSPGSRQHIFTYAAGISEQLLNPPIDPLSLCPCAGTGKSAPAFVSSNYYCESGNPNPTNSDGTMLYSSDTLWDGQMCGGLETTCCNPMSQSLPWFCTTLPTPVSGEIEVRLCMDEPIGNENIALQFFELYIK